MDQRHSTPPGLVMRSSAVAALRIMVSCLKVFGRIHVCERTLMSLVSVSLCSLNLVEYVCPKCGYFNAAPRTLRQQQSPNEGEGRALSPGIDHQPPLPKPNFLSVPDSPSNGTRRLSRSLSPPGNVSGHALTGSEEADQTQDSIMSVDE
jgi:hypothetical protein